jgi:glycosyltransferase involved in cell wall biosynthesis
MKIYFDNVNFSSNTGPNTFGSRLAQELAKNHDVEIVGAAEDYDVFLCFFEPTRRPRPPAKFFQRLDGIWFKPEEFESHNQLIKWAYRQADGVIWQSDFDKKMTTHWWGDRLGRIIHNGIDLQNRPQAGEEAKKFRDTYDKIFVCSSGWHRQKRLKENIDLFQKFAGESDILLVLGSNPDEIVTDSRIKYLGHLSHQHCLEIYSIADWMIHLAWLDHCPNVVVEALSQKCPVICSSSGGTKEIVLNNGIVVPEQEEYAYELCNYDDPPQLDFSDISLEEVQVSNHHLSINYTAKQYLEFFNFSRGI